jgi:hypothetical protein
MFKGYETYFMVSYEVSSIYLSPLNIYRGEIGMRVQIRVDLYIKLRLFLSDFIKKI